MLTPDEVIELKNQLRSQIQSLPDSQKQAAEEQINNMTPEALETMLKQQQSQGSSDQKTIFRMLIDKEVPSTSIGENDSALAILDINPISKGHAMVIPKSAIVEEKDVPQPLNDLAKELAEKISKKFGAKSAEILKEKKFGEIVVHIVPIYDKPLNLQSPRTKSTPEELSSLKDQLNYEPPKPPEVIKIEKKETPEEEVLKMSRKVP